MDEKLEELIAIILDRLEILEDRMDNLVELTGTWAAITSETIVQLADAVGEEEIAETYELALWNTFAENDEDLTEHKFAGFKY